MKKIIQTALSKFAVALSTTSVGRFFYEQILDAGMSNSVLVSHSGTKMVFACPNALTRYRSRSFSDKEPETLTWIEAIPANAVLWDVGSNIGLYSIYAALKSNARVFAFEPSVFNLELLARNIFLNGLHNHVTVIPLALSENLGPSLFKMSSTAWGGALSTFGKNFDQNGSKLNSIFEYQTMGLTVDQAMHLLDIPAPNFLKIDVDGIEHLILSGGMEALRKVESVLVEINDDFDQQAEESAIHLRAAGLVLKKKCELPGSINQYNQWWVRRHKTC